MNTAILSGIISTPQLRCTNGDKPVCEFYLTFANPSKSESTKQIKCLTFGKLAESAAQLYENQVVILEGTININNRDVNGTKTKITEFKFSSFDVLPVLVNVNLINLVGRTGRDPEIRYFESGTNKASVSLAVRRLKDETDWFDLEAWGKTGEVIGNYVRKGGLIAIQGQLKFEEWSDRNTGELRSKPVVSVGQLELLGSKQERNENAMEDF